MFHVKQCDFGESQWLMDFGLVSLSRFTEFLRDV